MFAAVEQFEIDAAGRVRDYQGTRLSRWQVTGRDFARELAWTVGAEAAARIARFRARALDLDRFCTRVVTRAGEAGLEVTLRQGKGGATIVSLQYGRDSIGAPDTASIAAPGRSSHGARLSGGASHLLPRALTRRKPCSR